MKVRLKEIAEKLDEVHDGWFIYLNRKTGEFLDLSEEELRAAEEFSGDDDLLKYPEWQRESIRQAVDLMEHWQDYVEFRTRYEINEYAIMEDFADTLGNDRHRERLFQALRGRGAFRRFKDTLHDLALENAWYDYRGAAFFDIAAKWCEENRISYSKG